MFWTLGDYDDDPTAGGHFLTLNSIRGIACLCAISRRGWCVHLHGTKRTKRQKHRRVAYWILRTLCQRQRHQRVQLCQTVTLYIKILKNLKHRLANNRSCVWIGCHSSPVNSKSTLPIFYYCHTSTLIMGTWHQKIAFGLLLLAFTGKQEKQWL